MVAGDDNDDEDKDWRSWKHSGYIKIDEYYLCKIDNYCNDDIYDGGLVRDSIDIGGDRGDIIGGEAAPDGVATQIIFVSKGEGGGVVLWSYLYGIILTKYGCVWIVLV